MNFKQNIKRIATFSLALAAASAFTSANAAYRETVVSANGTNTFTYEASPGETFRARISGDGDSDLDLYVRGPRGRVVCSGVSPIDEEACTVFSPNGGVYRIEVENVEPIANQFELWVR